MSEKRLRATLNRPIASPTLRELARTKRSAAIVVDDLTRPTPAHRVLPLLIEQLTAGGIRQDNISIIIGVGAHHPMLRKNIVRKIGKKITENFTVMNHNAFENCEYLGKSSLGTPIYINSNFLRADLKICVGSILPHGGPGFGGGAKLVFPGVAGIESIYQNHRGDNGYTGGTNKLEGNMFRLEMEEAAGMAGLDFIVNAVLNAKREIVGLFCGHYIAAHREGVKLARVVYGTLAPKDYDIAILSAYPQDSEFYQCLYASSDVLESARHPVVHTKGTSIFCSAASEGIGEHFLCGPGFRMGGAVISRNRELQEGKLYYSRNVSSHDIEQWGMNGGALCKSWREIISRLLELQGEHAHVAVFPCAAMQLGVAEY